MKKYRLACLALAILLLLTSCARGEDELVTTDPDSGAGTAPSSETPQDTTTAAPGLSLDAGYSIVRPDESTGQETEALGVIRDAMKAAGFNVGVKTDWLNTRKDEKPGEYEILIGETNREESRTALAELASMYDYTVRVVGNKVVVVGGCGTATLRAAEYFAGIIAGLEGGRLEGGLLHNGRCSEADMIIHLDGEVDCTFSTICDGVTSTHYALSADSKYGQQDITVVEFDPRQSNLYFDVISGGTYATTLKTVSATVKAFNESNGQGKRAVVAVNGDLWMVSYAHARVLGKGTTYKNCSDPVVKKSLTVPRGFNMYDGEIITSTHMSQETPYEGDFYSFGITDDGTAVLGNPQVGIKIANKTTGVTVSGDGVNRLPANNALVMYTDKLSNNYALDDAYEVVIDCGYDYVVRHGETIKGKVTAIKKSGESSAPEFKQNRIILTARGSRIDRLTGFSVGDSVEISINVTDKMGNNAAWQGMRNAVGGHMPIVVDGKSKNISDSSRYPMTILGVKDNGNVVMITYDGRQSGYAVGLKNSDADELCLELGVATAFFLDGGGSATMVQLVGDEYKLINRPSDKQSNGEYGQPRTVVNTVILSVGPKK